MSATTTNLPNANENNVSINKKTNVSQSRKPIINADLVNTPRSTACNIDCNSNSSNSNNKNVPHSKFNGVVEPTGEVIRVEHHDNNNNNCRNKVNQVSHVPLTHEHSRPRNSHAPVEYVIYNSKIPSIYGINYQMAQRAKEAKARQAAQEREFAMKQAAEMQCEAQQVKLAKQRERAELLSQLYKYNLEQSARKQEEQRRAREERVKYERALLASETKEAKAECLAQRQARLARQREMQAAYEESIRNKSVSARKEKGMHSYKNKQNILDSTQEKSKLCSQQEEQEYDYLFGDALARDARRNAQVAQRAKEVYEQNLALAEAKRHALQAHRAEEMRQARELDEIAAKELEEVRVRALQRKRNAAEALSNEWKTTMTSSRGHGIRRTSLERALHNATENNSAYLGTQRQYAEDAQRVEKERQHCKDLTEFNRRFAEAKQNERQRERNRDRELARIAAQNAACEAEALRKEKMERKREQQQAMWSASERAIRNKEVQKLNKKEAERLQIERNKTMNGNDEDNDYEEGGNFYNGFSDAERSNIANNQNRNRQCQSARVNKQSQKEFFEELHRDAEKRREAKKREDAEALAWEKYQIAQQQQEAEEEMLREKQKRAATAASLRRSLEAQIAAKRQGDNCTTTNMNNNDKSIYNSLSKMQQGRSLSPDILHDSHNVEPERKILYRCPVTHRLLPASAFDFGIRHRYANNESVGSTLRY